MRISLSALYISVRFARPEARPGRLDLVFPGAALERFDLALDAVRMQPHIVGGLQGPVDFTAGVELFSNSTSWPSERY